MHDLRVDLREGAKKRKRAEDSFYKLIETVEYLQTRYQQMKEEHVRTVTTFNERMQQFDTYESRFQSLEDRVDDLHTRLRSLCSKEDVEMELEPDLAERVTMQIDEAR